MLQEYTQNWSVDYQLPETLLLQPQKYLLAFPSRPWFAFYTDHHSDFDLMEMADAGVAVNPSAKLRRLAKEHQFPVVDWG